MTTFRSHRWLVAAGAVAVATAAGLLGGGVASRPALGAPYGGPSAVGPRTTAWQYTCVNNSGSPDIKAYNALGAEGWELVGFKGTTYACFKKPGLAAVATVLPPDKRFDTEAVKDFTELATATGGRPYGAPSAKDLPEIIERIFDENVAAGSEVDIAFVIDTTGSMSDDIDEVKSAAKRLLDGLVGRTRAARVGVVLYRDKGDDYVTKIETDLTPSMGVVRGAIGRITVAGGGDWPEHVYAGLMSAMNDLRWRPTARRIVILMGDAPAHEDYADWPTKEHVLARATRWGGEVSVYPVVVGR